MTSNHSKANITTAASKLRALIWSAKEGELLGSEEDVTHILGVSRPTVRQVARLLESEGLLRVKRGLNGGYFSARPSVDIVEASVSTYLQMVMGNDEEVMEIASALWTLVVRKVASLESPKKKKIIEAMRAKVASLQDDAHFMEILDIEDDIRERLFQLIESPYISLIFHINRVFAARGFSVDTAEKDDTLEHLEFVKAWKKSRMLELDAIADGDLELSEVAARHYRRLFHKRMWGHSKY